MKYLHNIVQTTWLLILVSVLVLASCSCGGAEMLPLDEGFLKALHMQESSGRMNPPDGDFSRAIGVYQIWRPYWQDAVEFDKTIGGTYQDCRKPEYAAKIVRAYLNRYARRAIVAKDFESLARCHNSGPNYAKKRALTDKYWKEFQVHLHKQT